MPTTLSGPLELHAVDLINAARDAAGLARVHIEVHLNTAAEGHANWMADAQTVSHTGQGDSTLVERAADAEFPTEGGSSRLAENLAYRGVDGPIDESDIAALHQALMDSPDHRANILDPDTDYVGIGLSLGQLEEGGKLHDVVFLTQNFGSTSLPVTVQEEIGGETFLTTYHAGEAVPGTSQPVSDNGGDAAPDPDDGRGQDDNGHRMEDHQQDRNQTSAGACFVATAAYGNRRHPDVVTLRTFRDAILVRHPAGRLFVRVYWRAGPVMAKVVHADRASGRLARLVLGPCVLGARKLLDRHENARKR